MNKKNVIANLVLMLTTSLVVASIVNTFVEKGTASLVLNVVLGFSIGWFWTPCYVFAETSEEKKNG